MRSLRYRPVSFPGSGVRSARPSCCFRYQGSSTKMFRIAPETMTRRMTYAIVSESRQPAQKRKRNVAMTRRLSSAKARMDPRLNSGDSPAPLPPSIPDNGTGWIKLYCFYKSPGNIPGSSAGDFPSGSRNAPLGTSISNRAPWPDEPVSWIVIPVIARISRARKRPKAGVLPVSLGEDLLLLVRLNPDPVVLDNDEQAVGLALAADNDPRHPLPVADRVLEEVEEDPLEHRVGKDRERRQAPENCAHNCMDAMEDGVHPGTELAMEYTGAAEAAFAGVAGQEQVRFLAGYAHRTFPYSRQEGFGDLGVQVLIVDAGGQKTAYVLFDGNNMQTGTRDEIRRRLLALVDECEVTTTDTHVVNTVSGRNQVGLRISVDDFYPLVEDAVREALADTAPARSGGATAWCRGIVVFGSQRISQIASTVNGMMGFLVPVAVIILAGAFLTTAMAYYLLTF